MTVRHLRDWLDRLILEAPENADVPVLFLDGEWCDHGHLSPSLRASSDDRLFYRQTLEGCSMVAGRPYVLLNDSEAPRDDSGATMLLYTVPPPRSDA